MIECDDQLVWVEAVRAYLEVHLPHGMRRHLLQACSASPELRTRGVAEEKKRVVEGVAVEGVAPSVEERCIAQQGSSS